jgi:hypothetical protein
VALARGNHSVHLNASLIRMKKQSIRLTQIKDFVKPYVDIVVRDEGSRGRFYRN